MNAGSRELPTGWKWSATNQTWDARCSTSAEHDSCWVRMAAHSRTWYPLRQVHR